MLGAAGHRQPPTDQTHAETAHTAGRQPGRTLLAEHTRAIHDAATIAPLPPGNLAAKQRALARRIRDRLPAYLAFATSPDIPFDNNAAEGEIRMVKIRQKTPGCLRTLTGAQHFAAICSYTATTRKHDINLYDAAQPTRQQHTMATSDLTSHVALSQAAGGSMRSIAKRLGAVRRRSRVSWVVAPSRAGGIGRRARTPRPTSGRRGRSRGSWPRTCRCVRSVATSAL